MARLSVLVCVAALIGLCAAALPQTVNHCGTDDVVTVRETPINGFVDSLMGLKWLTNEVVYARSVVHDLNSAKSVLYRSDDGGKTWNNEMSKFKNSEAGVYEVITTATDGKAWVTGLDKFLWVTTDSGASYQTVNIPAGETMVSDLFPHPYLSDYALVITESYTKEKDHYESLYSTTDFGATWTLVDTYVSQAQYAVEGLSGGQWVYNHTIIWTALPLANKKGSQSYDARLLAVYHTEDYGKTKHLVREHTPGLLVHQDAFFVAGWTSDPKSALTLYASLDGGQSFKQCVFPHSETLSELNYIILEASYGSAMVFVLHSLRNSWGNVYASDSFDTTFELSLAFAVAYQKNGYGTSYPDFMDVARIPGLYIANQWDVGTSPGPTANSPIVTVMSRNNGGTWGPIAPPRGSSCGGARSCSLQLRGPRLSTYGSFYSDPDAIGLIVSMGNVGTSVDVASTDPTTYVSRDAGLTWFAVDDIGAGDKTYEWADHGALFLAATTGSPSNRVFYSIIEGENFVECNYTGDEPKIKRTITDIYNDPKMETAAFIAVGSKSLDNTWVILYFDFRAVFRRTCVGYDSPNAPDSDYELWAPSFDGTSDCVLGQQTQYTRRKQYSQCFNGAGYEIGTNVTSCACTINDYRCADCYVSVTNMTGTFCVYSPSNCTVQPVAAVPPTPCKGSYFVATGWEKIPLDVCEGVPPGLGVMVKCPGLDTTHKLLLVIIVLVFLIFACVGGCWALANYNPAVREFWSRTVPGIIAPTFGRSNSSNATYSLLKKPDSMDDDEEALAEGSQAKELDDDTILNYSKDGKEKKDTKEAEIL